MNDEQITHFTNWSEELFAHPTKGGHDDHCSWDGVGFRFEPGESKWLPSYLAETLAKHLADRELIKEQELGYKVPDDPRKDKRGVSNPVRHKQLMSYAIGEAKKSGSQIESEIDRLNMNQNEKATSFISERSDTTEPEANQSEAKKEDKTNRFCEYCDSKGGRHKKACTRDVMEPINEAQFEGLKQ